MAERRSPLAVSSARQSCGQVWRGGSPRVLRRCCGLPLRYAGDQHGFERAARDFVADLGATEEIVVAAVVTVEGRIVPLNGKSVVGRFAASHRL